MKTLFQQISSFENLYFAFKETSRGKRSSYGYQKFLFHAGDFLKEIEEELKTTYKWGTYRKFYVYDPKKRLIMAAPFKDRIVHTAIHRVISPLLEEKLCVRSYACRLGKGNRNAVLNLKNYLQRSGEKRFCIKLDVKKYFDSIDHDILLKQLAHFFPQDFSLYELLKTLLESHPDFKKMGKGIPIGNLTSQLFANHYLTTIDELACLRLNLHFQTYKTKEESFYIRYMDDMILISPDKKKCLQVASDLIQEAKLKLKCEIPSNKYIPLGSDPIPFLGFVVDHRHTRPLVRNEQKFIKKIKRPQPYSLKAQRIQSYEAWKNIL